MNKKRPETTYSEQETTWNNLQQPTMSKKRPETTYNNLKRPIMNKKRPGNDLQRARKDLKQPTTSKTQPTVTRVYLQQAKKDAKQPTSRFWDDFTIWDNWFSPLTRFNPAFGCNHSSVASGRIMVKIGRQTFFYIIMCIYYGIQNLLDTYIANHFVTHKLTFARQKSTVWIKQKKSNFDIDETFRALKWLFRCFQPITLKNDWMLIILFFSNRIERFSNLLRLKYAFKFT